MTIAMIIDTPGGTQAQYDQVHAEVSPENRPPAGLLYHAAGPIPDGWRVIEVWASQEAAQRFFQEQLGAALARADLHAQPQVFEVVTTMHP